MKLLSLSLLLIALSLPCYARMGWTKRQMESKYGRYTDTKDVPGTSFKLHMYEVSRGDLHYMVFVIYVEGKVESVSYVNAKEDWSEAEIKAILKLNSEGERWTEKSVVSSYIWTRPTGQAIMSRLDMANIHIVSNELVEELDRQQKEFDRKKIEDAF